MLEATSVIEPIPPMVSPWTRGWGTVNEGVLDTTPTSTGWPNGNLGFYFPFYVPTTCVARRMWWVNGSTVSTAYMIEAGIYTDAGGKPGARLATTGSIPQGTTTQIQFADFGVMTRLITNNQNSTDQDTYSTASITLRVGKMYAISILNSHASSAPVASTVGTSTTSFTSRDTTQYDGNLKRVSLWTGVPSADDTDTIDIFFGSSSGTTACSWVVVEFDNVDTATNHGIVQTATNTGTGTTASATLSAFGSANNATLGIGAADANLIWTPGTGFSELTEQTTSTPISEQVFDIRADNDTSPDMTSNSSADWGFIGAEVKRASVDDITLHPGLYWMFMTCSIAAATFFRSLPAAATRALCYFVQTVIPGDAPPVATPAQPGNSLYVLFGIDTRGVG